VTLAWRLIPAGDLLQCEGVERHVTIVLPDLLGKRVQMRWHKDGILARELPPEIRIPTSGVVNPVIRKPAHSVMSSDPAGVNPYPEERT
jgi:hypothetical protein